MDCERCGYRFDPVRTRWLCPACRYKHHCCGHHVARSVIAVWLWFLVSLLILHLGVQSPW